MSRRNSSDEISWIKSLDSAAASPVPKVDVASAVMREIRDSRPRETPENTLPTLAAALASLAGATAAVAAVVACLGMQDPVTDLIEPLRLILQ